MKVETTNKLIFEGYTDQTLFQLEVIRILLSDEKYKIFYMGRTEDIGIKLKYYLFGTRKYTKEKIKGKELKIKWEALLALTGNPEWCIVMWKRVTDKCKFVPRKLKLKKDGTPRKPPLKKKKDI